MCGADEAYELPQTQAQIFEHRLQCELIGFRTMAPDLQKAFVTAILDEYTGRAKEGGFDAYFAGQMLTRVQLIAGFLNAKHQPGLRIIRNG